MKMIVATIDWKGMKKELYYFDMLAQKENTHKHNGWQLECIIKNAAKSKGVIINCVRTTNTIFNFKNIED